MKLTTDAELAEQFGLDLPTFTRMRQKHAWPHVRLGRFEIRFTDDQVAEIVRRHSQATKGAAAASERPTKLVGPTKRSASRRRSA